MDQKVVEQLKKLAGQHLFLCHTSSGGHGLDCFGGTLKEVREDGLQMEGYHLLKWSAIYKISHEGQKIYGRPKEG